MEAESPPHVRSVADARSGLSQILREFRRNPDAPAIVIGAHRKPEAAVVPYALLRRQLSPEAPRDTVLATITMKSALIKRLARLNHLDDVAVFGSVARGDDGPTSDVDLLVTPCPEASFFDLAQFAADIELLLDREVDVVSRPSLDPVRDATILAEAVAL